jgi:hypothetical protein
MRGFQLRNQFLELFDDLSPALPEAVAISADPSPLRDMETKENMEVQELGNIESMINEEFRSEPKGRKTLPCLEAHGSSSWDKSSRLHFEIRKLLFERMSAVSEAV